MRGGVIVDNFIIDATDIGAGNDKWTSTTVQTWTVPAGRTWYFIGGSVLNSADATVTCDIHNAADKIVYGLCSIAAPGIGVRVQYPDSDIAYVHRPIPMAEGWYVKLTMGAAQGAAAEATCQVLEFKG
ncbi:MAG: hypothetical protein ACYSUV_17230 [Planctomycetota bacterium]|jgi:hypothetical protein